MNLPEGVNHETWTDCDWPGNPELKLNASVKYFIHHSKFPVWIFGEFKGPHHLPPPANPDYVFGAPNFCVNAGANSDFSYTGLCVDCFDMKSAKEYVDKLHQDKKLIR